MRATSVEEFLKEFDLFADYINEHDDEIFIQRPNGNNVIMLSMTKYNDIKRDLYRLKQLENPPQEDDE